MFEFVFILGIVVNAGLSAFLLGEIHDRRKIKNLREQWRIIK